MRALVTGADGFVGRHLCAALRARGDDVIELGGPQAPNGVDVTESERVHSAFEAADPDAVVHLAGSASVARSHDHPRAAFRVNTLGTVHVLGSVRDAVPEARVLVVGSGEEYGRVEPGTRAREDAPLAPLSPYAASKAAAELAALQFHRSYGLRVVCTRSFNHVGAGQTRAFVVPAFAAEIAAARRASTPVVRVGDLTPVRDFSHVSDVVDAYLLLLDAGEPGEVYNVSSGVGRSVRELLDEMLELAGVGARVEIDPGRLRPVEIPSLVGDPSKLLALGWRPSRDLRSALRDVLAEHERG